MTEPVRTRVYLVRHCDVRNPDGVLYGHLPGFPLSEQGEREAANLGSFLAAKPIRAIVSSPLERAVQTATAIAALHPGVPVETTDDLIEAKFGLYLQGVKYRDVPRKRPRWLIHRLHRGLLSDDETVAAMAERVGRAVTAVMGRCAGGEGVCVSHGDPIQAYWVTVEGRSSFQRLDCAKGGVLQLDFEDGRLVSHTYMPPSTFGPAPPPQVGGTGTPEPGL